MYCQTHYMSIRRRSSQPISLLMQNTQPSQPIILLTLMKLSLTTAKNNTRKT